jgi:hypothetical protein
MTRVSKPGERVKSRIARKLEIAVNFVANRRYPEDSRRAASPISEASSPATQLGIGHCCGGAGGARTHYPRSSAGSCPMRRAPARG